MFKNDSQFARFILELAEESGQLLQSLYRKHIRTEYKSDASPVTEADQKTETLLRERIRKAFPEHGIFGEEYGKEREDAEFVWVLDPIDGTKSFIGGVPLFATLIALVQNGKPVLGAIHQPITGDIAIGNSTETLVNGKISHVRKSENLSRAILLGTDYYDVGRHQSRSGFDSLASQTAFYRTWGDAYGYFLVAAGLADIMVDPIMSPWDIMAVVPVIEGAGGRITDYQGNDAVTGTSTVAAHPDYHAHILKILAG